MRSIKKFNLEHKPTQTIFGPIEKIVKVGVDSNNRLAVWAVIDSTDISNIVPIIMLSSNEPMPMNLTYLDTVVMHQAWHIFTS